MEVVFPEVAWEISRELVDVLCCDAGVEVCLCATFAVLSSGFQRRLDSYVLPFVAPIVVLKILFRVRSRSVFFQPPIWMRWFPISQIRLLFIPLCQCLDVHLIFFV